METFLLMALWLYSPLDLRRFSSFLILYTVGRTLWTGDQPVARPLPTHRINTQTSMPRVGFELTTPVFDRAKMVHALDRAATVIGCRGTVSYKFIITFYIFFVRNTWNQCIIGLSCLSKRMFHRHLLGVFSFKVLWPVVFLRFSLRHKLKN
jgi:hypothetical protein